MVAGLYSVTVVSKVLGVGPAFNQFTVLIIDKPLGKPLNSVTVDPRSWVWGPAFNQFTVLIIDRPLGKSLNSLIVVATLLLGVWGRPSTISQSSL